MAKTPSPDVSPPIDEKRASFEREALVHLDSLYRVALRLTGNAADADDLVQETMLKAYRAWDQYEKGTNAKGWLLTILRHAFFNEYSLMKAWRRMVRSQPLAFVPFSYWSQARYALSIVSCTRSSASAALPVRRRATRYSASRGTSASR